MKANRSGGMMTAFQARTLAQWRQLGGGETAQEIVQQPAVWLEMAASLSGQATALSAFIGDFLHHPGHLLILTGAGTSAFIGEGIADVLNRQWPCEVRAIATTHLIASPDLYLDAVRPTLLVSFGRSGNSPESVAAVTLLRDQLQDVRFLNITCNAEGELYAANVGRKDSYSLLMPAPCCDRSFAMTSSYSTMLLAALLVLENRPWVQQYARVQLLARLAQPLLAQTAAQIAALAQEPVTRVVYLGSGPLLALARESALKVLELTSGEVVALFDSSLGFRHGPKSVVNRDTLVLCFMAADAHCHRYDLDLLAELRCDGIAARVVAVSPLPLPQLHEDDLVLPVPVGELDDVWLGLLWVMLAQQYALEKSVALGKTPDNPFPGGEVNRVVKGVTIYPCVTE